MTIAQYMQEFADRCAVVLGEDVSASITLRNHGMMLRTASSDDRAGRCDQVEARHNSGPCLTAMDEMTTQKVLNLKDENRWALWAAQAAREGFSSVAALPARVQPSIEVALNLYSTHPDPWTEPLLTAGASYAQLLASAVRMQIHLSGTDDDYTGSYAVLDDETIIEWAVGAVMTCNACPADHAREVLTSASNNRGIALREVAETILRALAPDHLI